MIREHKMKRVISILLAGICFVNGFTFCFDAFAQLNVWTPKEVIITNSPNGEEMIEIKNQVSPDLKYNLQKSQKEFNKPSGYAQEYSLNNDSLSNEFVSVDQAAKIIRDAMVNRKQTVTVCVSLENSISNDCAEIFARAKSEEYAINSVTGDYIYYQWQRFRYSYSMIGENSFQMVAMIYYYTTYEEEQIVNNRVEEIIDSYNLRELNQMDQVITIYNYLCENVVYDKENLSDSDYFYKYTCYAALVQNTAVCQGYALSFYRLCRELGIEARIITSDDHAWNIVGINGTFYNVDSTWDAPYYTNKKNYKYFLRCPDHFDSNHIREKRFCSEEFYTKYPMVDDCFDYDKYIKCNHQYENIYIGNDCHRDVCNLCGANYVQSCKCDETIVDATCITDGGIVKKCLICGNSNTQILYAHGHSFGDWKTIKQASCVSDGLIERTCQNCTKTETQTIDHYQHDFGQWNTVKPESCIENGVQEKVCNKCGFVETQTIDSIGHDYKLTQIIKPTCIEKGLKKYTCVNCQKSYSESVEMLGHTVVIDKAIPSTCSSTGLTDGSHCSVCNAVIKKPRLVAKKPHKYEIKTTKATTKASGKIEKKCNICGYVFSKTTIYKIDTVSISKISYIYDGETKKPIVTVKDNKGNKIDSSYYTVTYLNNKLVGKATVKIVFNSRYSGIVYKTFIINPRSVSITSLSALSKGFVVKWNKRITQVTGYQIQYSTSSNFTNPKTVTITSNATISKTILKLTARKKYFVRVRTYKTTDGTKYFSNWSSPKYVVTNK